MNQMNRIFVVFFLGLTIGYFFPRNLSDFDTNTKSNDQAETNANDFINKKHDRESLIKRPPSIDLSKFDSKVLSSIELDFSDTDPEKLIADASLKDPCSRTSELIHAYFREWAKIDHLKALSFAKSQPDAMACVNAVLEGWASFDPKSAYQWVVSNPSNGFSGSLGLVINRMAAIEPDHFISIADQIPFEIVQDNLSTLVDQFIVDGRKEVLFSWAHSLKDSNPLKADLYIAIMNSWGARNMNEVVEIFDKISSDDVRFHAMNGFVNAGIYTNPNSIYSWIEDNLSNDPAYNGFLNLVVEKWPDMDLHGYVSWISNLDENKVSDRMIQSLVSRTRDSDLLLTSEWMGKIKDANIRQQMTNDFISQMDSQRLEIVKDSSNLEVSKSAINKLQIMSGK